MGSVSASADATTIMDLLDDCSLEVFKWLDLADLCNVAETCRSFKHLTAFTFASSRKSNLCLATDIERNGDSVERLIFKTARVLQRYGSYFTKFEESDVCMCSKRIYGDEASREGFRRKIMELLVRFCSGILVELQFNHIYYNGGIDETAARAFANIKDGHH